MNPNDLRARVEREIRRWLDAAIWQRSRLAEAAECASLTSVLDAWNGGGERGPS